MKIDVFQSSTGNLILKDKIVSISSLEERRIEEEDGIVVICLRASIKDICGDYHYMTFESQEEYNAFVRRNFCIRRNIVM